MEVECCYLESITNNASDNVGSPLLYVYQGRRKHFKTSPAIFFNLTLNFNYRGCYILSLVTPCSHTHVCIAVLVHKCI